MLHGRGIDLEEAPGVPIGDPHGMRVALEQQAEADLLRFQGLFGLLAGATLLDLFQRPPHRRGEPVRTPLGHEVGRARFQRLHRALLPERGGEEDKREIRPALPRFTQGFEAVEGGEAVVGDDDVESAVGQGGNEGIAGLDSHDVGIHARLIEP